MISVGEVRRVDVTVEYISFPCEQSYRFCNESFFAYVWESNISVSRDNIPHPNDSYSSYRRFATINRQATNISILTIPLRINSKFIVLGFRDQGGCRELYSVKVTYNACPGKTFVDSLIFLPQTEVPPNELEATLVQGTCAVNSVKAVQGSLEALCKSTGEWNTSRLEGRCVCKEDMENTGGICKGIFHDIV